MSMFFALQKMPQYFEEEFSTGGILWFTNLAAADPYHILPILSAGSFLAIMELGKEQMMASSVNNPAQGRMMINFLRAVAVIMIPVTMDFSTAVFCYWTTNNTVSLIQTGMFRNANVRKSLGIWELPKVLSTVKASDANKGIVQTIQDAIQNSNKKGDLQTIKDQIKAHMKLLQIRKRLKFYEKIRNKALIPNASS
jgi:membrane protein insertase Oxa1/YidC/SpoIIIJ